MSRVIRTVSPTTAGDVRGEAEVRPADGHRGADAQHRHPAHRISPETAELGDQGELLGDSPQSQLAIDQEPVLVRAYSGGTEGQFLVSVGRRHVVTADAAVAGRVAGVDDVLGRKTGEWSGSKTDANKLTAWAYDTLYKGQLDSTTRYVSGSAYTKKVTAYDANYHATGTQLVLPANDALVTSGAVKDTLDFSTYYNIDGTQQYIDEPAAGGLEAEKITSEYNGIGLPTNLSGASGYVLGVSYSALGQTEQLTLGTSAATGTKKAYLTNTYEEGTGRLTQAVLTDQTHGYELQELNYAYDDTGNVTSIKDPTTLGGTSSADNQCFAYDGHRRLTEAWTPAGGDCTATRTTSALGGPSPYWTSYTYTDSGLRATETIHTTSATTTKTYCYSATQPHALNATTTAASCTGVTPVYGYDTAGNTTGRPDGSATQST